MRCGRHYTYNLYGRSSKILKSIEFLKFDLMNSCFKFKLRCKSTHTFKLFFRKLFLIHLS